MDTPAVTEIDPKFRLVTSQNPVSPGDWDVRTFDPFYGCEMPVFTGPLYHCISYANPNVASH